MKLNVIGVLFAAGLGLAVASPAEADQEADHTADKSQLSAFSGNNGPEFDSVWVSSALLIAGFAAGYGMRSLVSSRRRRRALGLRFGSLTTHELGSLTSHRLQPEADNSQISSVPRDDVGDLQSPRILT